MKKKMLWTASAMLLSMALLAGLTACGSGSSRTEEGEETVTTGKTMNAQPDVLDGTYKTEVSLKNSSDEVSLQTPATVIVRDGQATAVLVWNSADYDYMKVGDKKVEPITTEGGSTFRIQVPVFDETFAVTLHSEEDGEQTYSLTIASEGLMEDAADIDEELEADKAASEKTGQTDADQEEQGEKEDASGDEEE